MKRAPESKGWYTPREQEETWKDRAQSYGALVILAAAAIGFVVMAFPYFMAFVSEGRRNRYRHSGEIAGSRSDFWIKGDTKARAAMRFAAGGAVGAGLSIGYLVYYHSRKK